MPALVLIKGLLLSDEFKDNFGGGNGGQHESGDYVSICSEIAEFITKIVVAQCTFLQWPNILVNLPQSDLGSWHASPPFALSLPSLTDHLPFGGFCFLSAVRFKP